MSIVEKAIDKHRRSEARDVKRDDAAAEINGRGSSTAVLTRSTKVGSEIELDHDTLAREGVTPFGPVAEQIADEFRRLKRPLLAKVFGTSNSDSELAAERSNLVMVCSALAGEGKTFTAMNLAMSIALERDRTVVLVDADVAKPHVSRLLGLQDQPGLLDLLKDESLDVSEVLLQTDMPALKVIPAGQRDRYATELLGSQRMEAITRELGERYPDRIILFDSPPMLQTAEAPVLAGLMGCVLVVVHAGQTPQSAVMAAAELAGDVPLEFILNKSRVRHGSDYYTGYYYGYD